MNKKIRLVAASLAMAVLLSAGQVQAAQNTPSAYMNTLQQVTDKYPATRDQGDYSTCWAFTAISLAEMDLITDNHAADKSIDLSELSLTYDTYHPKKDAFSGTAGDGLFARSDYLNVGGVLDYCSRTLLQWRGLATEEAAPYSKAASYKGQGTAQAAHLQNISILNIHKNRSALKQEIMKHGAAGIGFCFEPEAGFNTTASYRDKSVATYYCDRKSIFYPPNHAAVVVGWDDDFPAKNFKKRPKKNGAWLVRNSWSDISENSINSYFWLSYEDKSLESEAWILDFEPADNYDYIYQYDGCPVVRKTISTCPVSANVFQVKGVESELLQAVSITLNEDISVPYTIKIYSNLSDVSNPRSGILEASVSGKTTYAGTLTIPLKQPVSLLKGSRYAVVVELGKKNAAIDMEISARQYPLESTAGIKKNQSFLYRNGRWMDVAVSCQDKGVGNLCIKGYTDRSESGVGKVSKIKAAASKTSARITWSTADSAQGYELYRSDSKNGTYRKIAAVKENSYKNTGLKKGKTYYYKVRGYQKKNGVKITGKPSSVVKASGKRG